MKRGYIKLLRKIEESSFYRDSEAVHLWLHILLKVSREPFEKKVSGRVVELEAGQMIADRKTLARDTGINESKVQRLLKTFEGEHRIEQESNNKSRIITVTNWHKYQDSEHQIEHQKTPPNKKKVQAKKMAFDVDSLKPEDVDNKTWEDFKEHRKKKKFPITERAMSGILREAVIAGMKPKAVLEIIMERGWRGFEADWVKGTKKHGRCDADGQYKIPEGKGF